MTVVVLGAGAGNRVGAGVNKCLIELAGRPLLAWSLTHALATTGVNRVVVVAAPSEHAEVADALSAYLPLGDPDGGPDGGPEVALVPGGTSRHGSEWAALQAVAAHVEAGRTDVVAIHDVSRVAICNAIPLAAICASLPDRPAESIISRSSTFSRPKRAATPGSPEPSAWASTAMRWAIVTFATVTLI